MVQPPEQPRRDGAEQLWLAYHEPWLQPLEWLTAWWDAFIVGRKAAAQFPGLHR